MHCVVLGILFCFVLISLFKIFIWFRPSAHRTHLSPMETFLVMRLLTPTQASLARSRSALMLSEQASHSGKRGQAGDTEENAPNGIGWPLSYSWTVVSCFTFVGFMKCLLWLITFPTHHCFTVAVFLFSQVSRRWVNYFMSEGLWIRGKKSISWAMAVSRLF